MEFGDATPYVSFFLQMEDCTESDADDNFALNPKCQYEGGTLPKDITGRCLPIFCSFISTTSITKKTYETRAEKNPS